MHLSVTFWPIADKSLIQMVGSFEIIIRFAI